MIPLFCQWVLRSGDDRLVLDIYKSVHRFTLGKYAKKLWKNHRIDTFDAIQLLEGLPEKFRTESYPRWKAKVEAGRS